MTRPVVLITGDCQALEIAAAAVCITTLTDRFEFVHLNCGGYGDAVEAPTPQQASRAVLHWRQSTSASPPGVDALNLPVKRLTFPTTALGVYLPFQVYDPLRPGRTWHGDRVLMDLEEQEAPLPEIAAAYEERSRKALPSPWRLRSAQLRLLEGQEAQCDVKPSAFMGREMFRRRLFWDFDHAAPPMIGWLLGELLRQSFAGDRPLTALAHHLITAGLEVTNTHPWHVPIPRAMREYLDLNWVSDDDRYLYDGRLFTEDEYLIAYATQRRAVRRGLAATAA